MLLFPARQFVGLIRCLLFVRPPHFFTFVGLLFLFMFFATVFSLVDAIFFLTVFCCLLLAAGLPQRFFLIASMLLYSAKLSSEARLSALK